MKLLIQKNWFDCHFCFFFQHLLFDFLFTIVLKSFYETLKCVYCTLQIDKNFFNSFDYCRFCYNLFDEIFDFLKNKLLQISLKKTSIMTFQKFDDFINVKQWFVKHRRILNELNFNNQKWIEKIWAQFVAKFIKWVFNNKKIFTILKKTKNNKKNKTWFVELFVKKYSKKKNEKKNFS